MAILREEPLDSEITRLLRAYGGAAASHAVDSGHRVQARETQVRESRDGQLRLWQLTRGSEQELVLSGELDLASRPLLNEALASVAYERLSRFGINLSCLTFMDSNGIHAILAAKEWCAERGVEFVLVPAPPHIQRLFEVSGLLPQLTFRDRVLA
jgi:anti-anti-sigma factor